MKVIAIKAVINRDTNGSYWIFRKNHGGAWLNGKDFTRMIEIEMRPGEEQEIEIRVVKRGMK